ncbi:hypothetical protein SLE2022_247800 [Rubroshorea leprosula]
MTRCPRPRDQTSLQSPRRSDKNVLCLLARREISPRTKYVQKRRWGQAPKDNSNSLPKLIGEHVRDARRGLVSWVEEESLCHLSAKYCPLVPPPRSTIAAAFSPDGRTLASTHGDHTVKIIDCQSGNCLKVLSGHRRTPWVVRFHPVRPEIIASGSLDHEVRLWNANTSECIGSRDFYRPIASIAFHAEGELLAVASGHKLYMWHYNRREEASTPNIVLRTKRSLRAVHFHPHAAPFLLTAEVNDLDSPDSSMTTATSSGYLCYPPPAVFLSNGHSSDHINLAAELPLMSLPFLFMPSFSIDDSRMDLQNADRLVGSNGTQAGPSPLLRVPADTTATGQYDVTASPMETFPLIPPGSFPGTEDTSFSFPDRMESGASDSLVDAMDTDEMQPSRGSQEMNSTNVDTYSGSHRRGSRQIDNQSNTTGFGQPQEFLPFRDPTCWEIPLLQVLLTGQQASIPLMLPLNSRASELSVQHMGSPSALHPPTNSNVSGRPNSEHNLWSQFPVSESSSSHTAQDGTGPQPVTNRIQAEFPTSLAVAAAAELPCTVKLRLWSHDIKNPFAPLNVEKCRLTIPHAVLCSEMGAHFSPCGKFLAACVACLLPSMEADSGLQTPLHQDPGFATSPTRHPISAHQVIYELRIYSLEEATFGSVLISRAIRAAHCLTSIQFSPTSEHILLAYGRRHGSLLKSIVIDGKTTSPVYTVLEVYRVSDMELVRVLPSAEDEVNVACFHPSAGGGLVYGTKEGRLRVLQYDGAYCTNFRGPNCFPEENMAELE